MWINNLLITVLSRLCHISNERIYIGTKCDKVLALTSHTHTHKLFLTLPSTITFPLTTTFPPSLCHFVHRSTWLVVICFLSIFFVLLLLVFFTMVAEARQKENGWGRDRKVFVHFICLFFFFSNLFQIKKMRNTLIFKSKYFCKTLVCCYLYASLWLNTTLILPSCSGRFLKFI